MIHEILKVKSNEYASDYILKVKWLSFKLDLIKQEYDIPNFIIRQVNIINNELNNKNDNGDMVGSELVNRINEIKFDLIKIDTIL